jgi:hypothetical protein
LSLSLSPYIYIYIYIERERERAKGERGEVERQAAEDIVYKCLEHSDVNSNALFTPLVLLSSQILHTQTRDKKQAVM